MNENEQERESVIINGVGRIVPGEDSNPPLLGKMSILNLILLLVRVRYEKHFPAKKKAILIAAGQKCGLIDEQGQRTAKYYGLVNDEVEKLARELTGQTKRASHPCLCGCGKPARGKAKYASMACRKRVSRWDHPRETSDVTVKPNSGL